MRCIPALALVAWLAGCRSTADSGGAASQLIVVAGSSQHAAVGTAVATAPSVRVQDESGVGIPGVTVRFVAVGGGGTVLGDSVLTGTSGLATVGEWIMGTTPGTNTLQAIVPNTSISVTIGAVAVPGAAVAIRNSGQAGFLALAGHAVSPLPTVLVIDSHSNPVPGATVTFTVTAGDGTLTGATAISDANGLAHVGSWTLGSSVGPNTIRAAIASGASLTLTAQGVTTAPLLAAASPVTQSGYLQYPVTSIPRVLVQDALGNPLAGVPVMFAVASGDATITGALVISDDSGIAAPGDWRLGLTASTLTATTGLGATPVSFAATGVAAPFVIDVRFLTVVNADQRDAFIAAAHRWMTIITAHLTPVALNLPAGACTDLQPAMNETVRDVVIFAEVTPIDGVGNILGSASPCASRSGTGLTIVGTMQFDSADLQALVSTGQLVATITHEMAHVLGFGTAWSGRNLTTGIGGADPRFIGASAVAIWPPFGAALGFAGLTPPLENIGGAGTAGSHWRESVFHTELMTGYIEAPGVPMPLSRMTIATFQDLGYQVDYSQSDPFAGNLLAAGSVFSPPTQIQERIGTAKWDVTPSGTVRPIQ
jgi:hypothetical protein